MYAGVPITAPATVKVDAFEAFDGLDGLDGVGGRRAPASVPAAPAPRRASPASPGTRSRLSSGAGSGSLARRTIGRSDSGASTSSRLLASPQSITTVSPNSPIRMFAGLRSRWITRWLCAYAIASVAAAIRGSSASRSSSVLASAITRSSGRPDTSFIAKNGSPDGQRPASYTGTIPGCCSRAVISASRWNRPRCSSPGSISSLSATARPSRWSSAATIRPMPPRAISRSGR